MTEATAASPFSPLKIGPLTLKNRFIKAGANEGLTGAGLPTKALVKHHREIAAGGVAMTTVAYGAVSAEGRTFTHQFYMNKDVVRHLRVLTDAVHAEGAAACLQITHGGSFTMLRTEQGYPLSASSGFNAFGFLQGILWQTAMQERDMQRVAGEFAQAALLAQEAGFDAVEIHMGHGYLLNQFLSPLSNKRKDQYGGSVEARTRFPAQVLRQVKDAVGQHLAVTCKINQTDAAKGGIDVQQAAVTAALLEAEGADMLTLSGGHNMHSPWALFGSPMPIGDMKAHAKGLARIGPWALGLQQPKDLSFRELYFLETARQIRQKVTMPLALVGGVKSLSAAQQVLKEGIEVVALARALIHDPQFVNKLQSGQISQSACNSCNRCVMGIYDPNGVRCVFNPPNDSALVKAFAGD
ncbi:NADH:flavin oxidoreductase [Pseudomonas sp. TTU2014-080ASC]|uniref:NADH:flavin oxidoreductase n=1 Tax=Pseudomonas sp. TTU2014-080ASC TaxID=1729724 RepID=UPI0007185A97|nr:NADH:flavin oxidoreductase [Pseudomonas sp. TTU2014-080ASC]KRW57574.1 flavin oxidoreductase [Pseudomonas sp. TTU2014-080ASC]